MRNGIPNKSERRTMQLEAHYKHLEAIRDEIWVSLHGQSSPHNHPACEVKHMNSPGKRLSTRLLAIERDANRYWTAVCNGTRRTVLNMDLSRSKKNKREKLFFKG